MKPDVSKLVEQLIRPEVRELSAYHVPDAGSMVKLDAMENPYPWPGELKEEWLRALEGISANRYPDPAARNLNARIRQAMGVPDGLEVLLGNGSDELIQLILMAVARPGCVILAPEPTFVMYRILSRVLGLNFVGVPLLPDDFSLDLPAMLEALEAHRPAVVFLAYPNNPTGNLFKPEEVRTILRASRGLVVVDEAYTPFARQSFLDALLEYPNLLVMRTVSKMGLAGLRLGWLAGAPEWIGELNKLRLPYNINLLTQVSAEFAFRHREILDGQTVRICKDRRELFTELSSLDGITIWPSHANFLLFRVEGGGADETFASLREQGVLIKKLHGSHPLLDGCLRVTVGTPEENRAFLTAVKKGC
ncbi:MAG: histidinol-phosphate transaminase [Gammaproteobacteria bacterium]|nr:histidinol-phosphate transaminase [Gammaproteobacteria bacterium]